TWVFFVGDQTAPTVTFWPAVPDTFSIPYNAHLYMHFSEPIAMDDGTQVSVDPTLLSNNIASFISLEKGTGPTSVDFGVEFVGSDKQTLRITPNDVDGYNYDGTDTNPTMETETAYNLSIIADNLTYELVDANGNVLDITDGGDVDFVTEDITSPVITGLVATNPTANSADIEFDIDEDGTAWVYAVQGAPETDPTVAEIKENAQWTDDVETGTVDAGTVEVGETVGSNDFTVYVVAEDDETDPYADPDPTLWIFDETEDNVNAIRDLLPAPNVSETVSATFTTCDDDAPQFVTSVPLHGAEGVATDQEIVIVFSEDITTSATTPNAVTLRKSMNNAAVGSTFNIIGSDSIVITPDVALEEETTYYVEIDRYAITDLGGCDGPNLFGEWVGKENLEFSTIDMTAPVVAGYFPTVDSTCVETDLTYVRVYLDETNDLAKAGEGDEIIKIKHDGVTAQTVPFHSEYVTFGNDEEDGKYLEISIEGFILLSDVQVTIEIPADVIADEYDNVLSSAISWSFYTIDNVPPVVSWTLYDWNTYFNNSDPDEIGIDKFNAEYDEGGEGETVTSAPTHSLLKIEFDEYIDMQAGDEWLSLTDFNATTLSDVSGAASDGILSRAEIFDNIEVGDLEYNDDSVTSDLYIYEVAANYIVIGYSDSVVSDLLVEAVEDGTSDLVSATGYFGSLMSETTYPVTIKSGSISDPLDCDDNRIVRENEDVVVLDTRDDTPPAITFSTCVDECIDGQAPITLTFSREVVKSSYDISWTDIEHESHTYDNLPLSTDDIEATGDDRYIEFYQLASADSTVNSVVDVTDVTFDGKTGITFVPESKLSSDSLYLIKFNKWTVKEYIENDPTGALFEGDSCYFRVSDYLAPYVVETTGLSPDSADIIASSVTDLVINFNEDVALGAEGLTTKVRREDGSVYAEFTIGSDDSISIDDNEVILYIEDGFEQFTKYYVEMPDGFITDFDTICTPNNFEGFSASL
ncbi:MAG: Ig-like domain-containing protein, partial [Prolixibacteraceae bacterium]|nr:Ig-like domain-containing protein [Prolixibacteraceae bacterium]